MLQPVFNDAGDEVWITVWSRQDEPSAIVVMDDKTLQLKQVIKHDRLVTTIRTYALSSLISR